jgi:hypothetical protein
MPTTIQLDPIHNGSTIRKAFLAEALLNLFTIPLLTHPRPILSLLLNNPAHINSSTVLFARLFGALVVGGLTPALFAGLPNTRTGISSRPTVYVLLGMGEVGMIPFLLQQALGGGGRALGQGVAWATLGCLVPPLLWRIYVLFVRPDLMGRYREVNKDE